MNAKRGSKKTAIPPIVGDDIISREEASALAASMQSVLGPEVQKMAKETGVDFRFLVVYFPVSERLGRARRRLKLTLKALAKELDVMPESLTAIEKGWLWEIEPEILERYVDRLGIRPWFERWQAVHSDAPFGTGLGKEQDDEEAFTPIEVPPQVPPAAFRFRVTLQGSKPSIWRKLELPDTATFWDLHCAIQDVMGWEDAHPHDFQVRDPETSKVLTIGLPMAKQLDFEVLLDWKIPLRDMLSTKNRTALYMYDFGDSWIHEILLEGIFPREQGKKYPRCTGGANACPPDDCGGLPGYYEMLKIMNNPRHPEHDEMAEWLGRKTFDPTFFNPGKVRFRDARKWLKSMSDFS